MLEPEMRNSRWRCITGCTGISASIHDSKEIPTAATHANNQRNRKWNIAVLTTRNSFAAVYAEYVHGIKSSSIEPVHNLSVQTNCQIKFNSKSAITV
jgi:hypothetical protein